MSSTINLPLLKGDVAVDGNTFMIGFFLCFFGYLLLFSPIFVEIARKPPSAPVTTTTTNNYYCGVKPCSCVGSANNPAADNPPPPSNTTADTTADATPRATHGTRGRAGAKEAMSPAPDKRDSASSKSSTGSGSGFNASVSPSVHVTQGLRYRSGRSPGRRDSAPIDGWNNKKGELLPVHQ
ncbi:hypothetical protein CNMCM6805_009582 [Aspergillus fumigatiaffinis]|uniref:Uncharacterized protein n=1 Tax=Aspergillus fumigatiaffinis TaxID=340414 RepID=A0A8H4H0Q0_9EURO|nr:hypothetical protein CNMCM6805_009582 [Aspergillus fumigatiaffinis]